MIAAASNDERPLAGRRVAVLEHRELDRLGGMLEAQGAATLRCPLVAIVDAPEAAPVLAWIERFVAEPPDALVLMTGEGLRRLVKFAEQAGSDAGFRAALGRVRTIIRGPKPARALRELGLNPGIRAEPPTTDGVVAALGGLPLANRRVGVQLYPGAPPTLIDFLSDAGARPDPVTPYAYVPAAAGEDVALLIAEAAAGRVDAIAFTSATQVSRLFEVAGEVGSGPELAMALRRTAIAAVGPVVAAELGRRGLAVAIMPKRSFLMKPLVTAIVAALSH